MRPARVVLAGVSLAAAVVVAPAFAASSGSASAPFFPGCAAPTSSPSLTVGRVACLQLPSPAIGGTTAFSYFIPPACAPATGHRCPVFYELHGFGGSYTSMLGTGDDPSAYVAALTSGPAKDPHTVSDPWNYSDPAKWLAKPSIDAVLVAPDGRTVPGGYGPSAGLDGYWVDWNPRYAKGGDHPRYNTPPPQFEKQLLNELMPYVESTFPVAAGRDWRALVGESLGGFGSYAIGLRHPDLFASVSSVSGAMNFLFAPGIDPGRPTSPAGATLPAQLPTHRLPGVATRLATAPLGPAQDFLVALLALGDPAADQAYFRGRTPRDLAANGRAWSYQGSAIDLRAFSNDAIAHNPRDLTDPAGYAGAQAFEAIVLPMNIDQKRAFRDVGVAWHYERHPGTHSGEYWNAWYRGMYANQYYVLRHWNGSGQPQALPRVFDFRSTDASFAAWGWQFTVTRPTSEFLNLTDVTCDSITLRGTGRVSVTVPATCGTGLHGQRSFTVNLGPTYPTDETGGAGASSAYGRTVTVALTA